MAVTYLLDTNIISETMRQRPNRRVARSLQEHADECATSSTVWHELLFGCLRLPASRRREKIESYLYGTLAPNMPILPYDEDAAAVHAQFRMRAAEHGRGIPTNDGQIAATAFVHGLILVTANVTDFAVFEGLQVENWLA